MTLAERIIFLQDVFQMTAIALVSVINYYYNGLHLFCDILYNIQIKYNKYRYYFYILKLQY